MVSAGEALLEIGDPADLEIIVDLRSADAVKVAAGQRVIIEGWGGVNWRDELIIVACCFIKRDSRGMSRFYRRVHGTIDNRGAGVGEGGVGG